MRTAATAIDRRAPRVWPHTVVFWGWVATLGVVRWRGGWRMVAAVPAGLMGLVVIRLLVGVSIDPTSHNLWPVEIPMAGLISTVIMVLLTLARRATGAAAA